MIKHIMNARRILEIFKHVFSTQNNPLTLGRCNIHNHKKTILKLQYANKDNCGISGYNNPNPLHDNHQYIYMMGYESIPI